MPGLTYRVVGTYPSMNYEYTLQPLYTLEMPHDNTHTDSKYQSTLNIRCTHSLYLLFFQIPCVNL